MTIRKLLVLWILVLSILYTTLSIVRHNHFQSGGFDLGIYDQAVWQYSQLLWPYNTVKERFILGDHLTLTLPILAPLFWIANDVRALLVFQAFWISLSTLAIYLLARARKLSSYVSFIISFVYSIFYGIQSAVFFDFHPIVLGVGLLAWLVYFLETKRKKLFWITLIATLLTQENMGLALVSLGFIYIWKKEYRKIAIAFMVGGLTFSLLASRIIASFSPVGFEYTPHISLNPITTLTRFFDTGEKREVWQYTLGAFSFVPLFSPGAILAVGFDLSQYFVTGNAFNQMWTPWKHHRAILAIFLVLGTLDVFSKIKKKNVRTILATTLFLSALVQQYIYHFPLNKLAKRAYWQNESWMQDNNALIHTISPDARIATQQSLIPHLTHRKEIYLFWPREHDFDDNRCGKRSCWWLDFNNQAQYLVVDTHPNQWLTQLLETNEHVEEAIATMKKSSKITLVKEVGFAKMYQVH